MKRPWHIAQPDRFTKTKTEIEKEYGDLRVIIEGDTVLLRGTFDVKDGGAVLDRYQIEVSIDTDHPNQIPLVREIGGRIPWHSDRHVETTGNACVVVPEEWLIKPEHESVLEFLDGPVRDFFLYQSLVEHGVPWPEKAARSHGLKGLCEAYGEMVGTADERAIALYLDYVGSKVVKGHWNCPCGSGKKLRDCHIEDVKKLRERIPRAVAQSASRRLADAMRRK